MGAGAGKGSGRGVKVSDRGGHRRPFKQKPEEKLSHAHLASADWVTAFPFLGDVGN